MTPEALIAEAMTWLDTPFQHQGREKGVGVDCCGVTTESAKKIGLKVEDRTNYSHQPSGILQSEIKRQMDRVPFAGSPERLANARVADVFLMSYDEPQHLAIVTSINPIRIIHAFAQAKKVVEQALDLHMQQKVVAVYRFKEFADG